MPACQPCRGAGLPALPSCPLASVAVLPTCRHFHFAILPAFCYNDLNPCPRNHLTTNFVLDAGRQAGYYAGCWLSSTVMVLATSACWHASIDEVKKRKMTSIIAIASQKGGVGKTTTAVNLAVCLAYYHQKKTLLVDLDLSCNATACLGYEAGSFGELRFSDVLVSVLKKQPIPLGRATLATVVEGLSLIPGDREITSFLPADYPFLLQETLRQAVGEYDFVLLDTPPSRSPITTNTYFAADWLIVPVEAAPLALEGLADTIDMIQRFSRQRANIDPERFYRILLTKRDARETKSNQFVAQELGPFKDRVLETAIRINADIKHAQELKQSIFHYDHKSPGATDYFNLTKEILAYEQTRITQNRDDRDAEPARQAAIAAG